jgi:hypothetical protein
MSRIAQMAEEMKRSMEEDIHRGSKKVAVSLRLDTFTIHCVDFFAKEVGSSRSAVCQELLAEGVLEALEALGFEMIDLQAQHLAGLSGRTVEEMKAKLEQTGIFFNEESK